MTLGINRLPHDAQHIVTADADIKWRNAGWATKTIHALDLYPVVQPWSVVHDLGPNNELLASYKSFASQYHAGHPVVPTFDTKTLQLTNSPYDYPHPGFAWGWLRSILDMIGGLFDIGGVGAGDHHMALGLIGDAEMSMPPGTNKNYHDAVMTWQERACAQVNKKIGFVDELIDHPFHGRKVDRGYNARWGMFLKYDFDPHRDLKRNTYGVVEFSGSNPPLEREWARYMTSRNEDANTLK